MSKKQFGIGSGAGAAQLLQRLEGEQNLPVKSESNKLQDMDQVDGRTLRTTGRTQAVTYRLKPETVRQLKYLATSQQKPMGAILEVLIEEEFNRTS